MFLLCGAFLYGLFVRGIEIYLLASLPTTFTALNPLTLKTNANILPKMVLLPRLDNCWVTGGETHTE